MLTSSSADKFKHSNYSISSSRITESCDPRRGVPGISPFHEAFGDLQVLFRQSSCTPVNWLAIYRDTKERSKQARESSYVALKSQSCALIRGFASRRATARSFYRPERACSVRTKPLVLGAAQTRCRLVQRRGCGRRGGTYLPRPRSLRPPNSSPDSYYRSASRLSASAREGLRYLGTKVVAPTSFDGPKISETRVSFAAPE